MPRDIYNDTVIAADGTGKPTVLMTGVLVTVYKAGTTNTATIYQDRASPTQQPNPFTANNGVVRFWADQGEYDVAYHDNLLRIADQTIGWCSMPAGAGGISQSMLAAGASPPAGAMFPFVGSVEPTGYKFANGQALSKATYTALYNALGGGSSPYGQDATTFNLPDLRSRSPIGAGQGAGLSARQAGTYGGGNLDTASPKRAEESHILGITEIPGHSHGGGTGWESNDHTHYTSGQTGIENTKHTHAGTLDGRYYGVTDPGSNLFSSNVWNNPQAGHTAGVYSNAATSCINTQYDDRDHSHAWGNYGGGMVDTNPASRQASHHTHGINAEGGGQSHNNMPPFLALNYIIRDGT